MKKKTLTEELERIHKLTYGKLNENFIQDIVSLVKNDNEKKEDNPKKADYVTTDVTAFFNNLEAAKNNGGLTQQNGETMSYQREVETMQIGLMMLGYDLPKYGVDGLFGPETAAAVTKFTQDNVGDTSKPLSESVNLVSSGGGIIGNPGAGTHNASDWQSGNAWDVEGPEGSKVFSLSNGIVDKIRKGSGSMVTSGVKKIYGDQVTIKSNEGKPDIFYTHIDSNLKVGDPVKEGDVIGTIVKSSGIPSHVHVGVSSGDLKNIASGLKGNVGSGIETKSSVMTKATPEMLLKLIDMLKTKGIKPEDLKKYLDIVTTGGNVAFTDIDLATEDGFNKYKTICDKVIRSRNPNAGIDGGMMAKAAKRSFDLYHKYVPPELALAQLELEGGLSTNPQDKPIRTNNPFNVGNTTDGKTRTYQTKEEGINVYYDLISRNYLGKGKTASDLIKNFVNKEGERYADPGEYEAQLNKLIPRINATAKSVTT
jgi:murein DD-endopeptidase MepM/ murein hydrolase activator NlpD